ncbi:MAG: GDP-mannose 4,6-dehydratase [Actinomycetota bacterium]|nr:GDP-mannose 4,6-dehydratase [Actinomycetota bacterium]
MKPVEFKRVLITGADGFVAFHLIDEIERFWESEIKGIGLRGKPLSESKKLGYRVLDITQYAEVLEFLRDYQPDAIFHLAALASVAGSWANPVETYRVNIFGQLNLLEALRELGIKTSIHIACSSEEYGMAEGMPVGEDFPLRPTSHYAVSKVCQEMLGLMYERVFSWRVIVTRSFNQAGPAQSVDFVVSAFAKQIAEIEAGIKEPVIKVGNLKARRDFTDVRDTVRALRLLMEKGRGGVVYNVCSESAVQIDDILRTLLGMAKLEIKVEEDPERARPSDIPVVLGDARRIREETGWKPEIPLEKTLADTLSYWRSCVGG